MYPIFYVGFLCKGCVWERVWRLKAKWRARSFHRYLARSLPAKWSMSSAHDWNAKSHDRLWQLVFTSVSWVRPSHEIPAKHSVLSICHIRYTKSLHTHTPYIYIYICISTLPTFWKECFSERNPSHYPWKKEIVIPTILYTIHCGFPQLLPLHFQILERLIAQTLTTPILSVKWGFGAIGKHWKKASFGRCNRAYCGIWKAKQDMVPRSLVGVRVWRS